jgi:hypothetical protein
MEVSTRGVVVVVVDRVVVGVDGAVALKQIIRNFLFKTTTDIH